MTDYLRMVPSADAAIANERALLSTDDLPDCARRVLDGHRPTRAYWRWLISQSEHEGRS